LPLSGNSYINKSVQGLKKAKKIALPLFGWWPEYKKSKIGVLGLGIAVFLIIMILIGPYIAPFDPTKLPPSDTPFVDYFMLKPSWTHWLGTDHVGRDVWSILLTAGRMSLFIGVMTAFLITSLGTVTGLTAGYFGGLVDELLMRLADIMLVLPRLPLVIIMAAYMHEGGAWTLIMLLTFTGWSGIARQVRAQTLSCKERSFVEASRAAGASSPHIIIQHILPNVAGVVIANFIMEIVVVILIESSLSFLNLTDPLIPTYGIMLRDAQQVGGFSYGAWWWFVPPGACIALIGIGFSYIGNTLNDRFVLRLGSRGKA
jgi:peptide/nickel transport system permease protein